MVPLFIVDLSAAVLIVSNPVICLFVIVFLLFVPCKPAAAPSVADAAVAPSVADAVVAPSVTRLPDFDRNDIRQKLRAVGHDDDVMGHGGNAFTRQSFKSLDDEMWVVGEVLTAFLKLLCVAVSKKDGARHSHAHNSQFLKILLNEGYAPPKKGTFEYELVKRWTKHIPSK